MKRVLSSAAFALGILFAAPLAFADDSNTTSTGPSCETESVYTDPHLSMTDELDLLMKHAATTLANGENATEAFQRILGKGEDQGKYRLYLVQMSTCITISGEYRRTWYFSYFKLSALPKDDTTSGDGQNN